MLNLHSSILANVPVFITAFLGDLLFHHAQGHQTAHRLAGPFQSLGGSNGPLTNSMWAAIIIINVASVNHAVWLTSGGSHALVEFCLLTHCRSTLRKLKALTHNQRWGLSASMSAFSENSCINLWYLSSLYRSPQWCGASKNLTLWHFRGIVHIVRMLPGDQSDLYAYCSLALSVKSPLPLTLKRVFYNVLSNSCHVTTINMALNIVYL